MTIARTIKKINFNHETRVITILFLGQSTAIEAKALDLKTDSEGNVLSLLLDRLIHKPNETEFKCFINDRWEVGFTVLGCFVSELSRSFAIAGCV